MAVSGLKTRQPTGRVPWPCILLEGEEKAGKSWALAQFRGSAGMGALYGIALKGGPAEEYGGFPGANSQLVEHDGSSPGVRAGAQPIRAGARRAADAGEPPV